MCEVMAAAPVMARFVGGPNVLVSHTWLYRLTLESRSQVRCRVYLDGAFSINERVTLELQQAWWDTTFTRECMPARTHSMHHVPSQRPVCVRESIW